MDRLQPSRVAAGVGSLLAALVHGGLAPSHFAEWWGYGLFFSAAALAQVVLAIALFVDPFDPARMDAARAWRILVRVGFVGQLVLIAFYAWTRVLGIPLGPGAGETESIERIDLLVLAFELASALALARLIVASRVSTGVSSRQRLS